MLNNKANKLNTNEAIIYYGKLRVGHDVAILAATDSDLIYVSGFNEDESDLKRWLTRRFSSFRLAENNEKLAPYFKQFQEYFAGERQDFNFSIKLYGTVFQQQVWEQLQAIPYGEKTTYSDIAIKIGNPKSVRAVGSAIGKNPLLIVVPCHRVLNKNGNLGGFRAGLEMKKALLQLEKHA